MSSTATRPMTPAEAHAIWRGPEPRGPRPGPAHALTAARNTFLACDRVEMRTLAGQLGIGRSTLYRWVGDRVGLLGEVVWGLWAGLLVEAADAGRVAGVAGVDAITHASDHVAVRLVGFDPLCAFLSNEPEAALRVLTTGAGRVQERCIGWFAATIGEEQAADRLRTDLPADDLAYAVVRIGEALLYADQLTGTAVDRGAARRVIRAVLGA